MRRAIRADFLVYQLPKVVFLIRHLIRLEGRSKRRLIRRIKFDLIRFLKSSTGRTCGWP
jgi:hypothetical protein